MKKKSLWLCATLLALNLALIWGNSLLPGDTSGEISGGMLSWLTQWLGKLPITELVLRKMGHFSEFACLGLLLTWLWQLLGQEGFHRFTMPIFCGMTAACIDEAIQAFVPERGPSVLDVWLDVAGVCAGILLWQTGYHIIRKTRKSEHLEDTT